MTSVGRALNDKPILGCNQNKTYEPGNPGYLGPFLGISWAALAINIMITKGTKKYRKS
jgi:hypothetical protein